MSLFLKATMSSYGRKRKRSTRFGPYKRRRTVKPSPFAPSASLPIVPGYTRTSGYYGRYAGMGGRELKFFDTALGFTFDTTGEVPTTGQLVLIPQGVTESTRIGRKCVIKSITIRGGISSNISTATSSATTCHLFLVLDKQCNGAAANATDVLTSTSFSSALRNLSNSERFKIMKRWDVTLASQAGVQGAFDNARRFINWTKKCNIPIEYSSTTGMITEIRSNNLFLLAGSAGTDDVFGLVGTCRVRFSDN